MSPNSQGIKRPPFTFSQQGNAAAGEPVAEPAVKAARQLRFGSLDVATKAIATDLYRSEDDYFNLRVQQSNAFLKFMRFGDRALDTEDRKSLKRVVLTPRQISSMAKLGVDIRAVKTEFTEIVDTLGGWLVPEDHRLDLIERLPSAVTMRGLADVTTTSSDRMTRVKVLGGGTRYPNAVRVTWVGDTPADDQADTSTTFGVVSTPIHIVKATVPVPTALLEDTAYPLSDKINSWVADAYAIDENEQFLIGTGIAKPLGLLPDSTNGNSFSHVHSGGSDFITADAIKNLKHAVARQYRAGCVWWMNDATSLEVSKLKDQEDRYLWEDTLKGADEPDTLLGYPVMIDEAMPDIAASAYPIIFGNPKGYQIADRIGMSVTRDDITQSEQDIVKFMFRRRLGAQPNAEWMFAVMVVSVS